MERSWQQGAEAPWEGGNRQKRPKRSWRGKKREKAPGKTQTKARWAEGRPFRDRKLQSGSAGSQGRGHPGKPGHILKGKGQRRKDGVGFPGCWMLRRGTRQGQDGKEGHTHLPQPGSPPQVSAPQLLQAPRVSPNFCPCHHLLSPPGSPSEAGGKTGCGFHHFPFPELWLKCSSGSLPRTGQGAHTGEKAPSSSTLKCRWASQRIWSFPNTSSLSPGGASSSLSPPGAPYPAPHQGNACHQRGGLISHTCWPSEYPQALVPERLLIST